VERCGGSEVRIICAATSSCGRQIQSPTSINVLLSGPLISGDYPGLDRSRSKPLRWLRQSGAILFLFIALLGIPVAKAGSPKGDGQIGLLIIYWKVY